MAKKKPLSELKSGKYKANRDILCQRQNDYYWSDPEKYRARVRAYYEANRARCIEKTRRNTELRKVRAEQARLMGERGQEND